MWGSGRIWKELKLLVLPRKKAGPDSVFSLFKRSVRSASSKRVASKNDSGNAVSRTWRRPADGMRASSTILTTFRFCFSRNFTSTAAYMYTHEATVKDGQFSFSVQFFISMALVDVVVPDTLFESRQQNREEFCRLGKKWWHDHVGSETRSENMLKVYNSWPHSDNHHQCQDRFGASTI